MTEQFDMVKAQLDVLSQVASQSNNAYNLSIQNYYAFSNLHELVSNLFERLIPEAEGMQNLYFISEIGLMAFPKGDKMFIPSMLLGRVWEPEQTALFRKVVPKGGTFVDLGSHVGWHSFSVARHVSDVKIIAIEASPVNASIFKLNQSLLGLNEVDIRLFNVAAWNKNEKIVLSRDTEENSGDIQVNPIDSKPGEIQDAVRLEDLSIFADVQVDVVKSDLQGVDQIAFRGFEKIIKRDRPLIVVEFWPYGISRTGEDPQDVLDYYVSLGYHVTNLDGSKFDRSSIERMLEGTKTKQSDQTDLLLTPS